MFGFAISVQFLRSHSRTKRESIKMIKLGLPGSKGCVRVKDCTVGDGVVSSKTEKKNNVLKIV